MFASLAEFPVRAGIQHRHRRCLFQFVAPVPLKQPVPFFVVGWRILFEKRFEFCHFGLHQRGLIAPVLAEEVSLQSVDQHVPANGRGAQLPGVLFRDVPVVGDFMVIKDHVGHRVGEQLADLRAGQICKARQITVVFCVLSLRVDILHRRVPAIPGIGRLFGKPWLEFVMALEVEAELVSGA